MSTTAAQCASSNLAPGQLVSRQVNRIVQQDRSPAPQCPNAVPAIPHPHPQPHTPASEPEPVPCPSEAAPSALPGQLVEPAGP
eukprot:362856-Chlamydomonas_euryale.AAC.11